MFVKLFILFICCFQYFNLFVLCKISNERRCVDSKCSVPISLAKTLITYNSDDERFLSFPQNVEVKIYSKEAGDKPLYWEAEVDGKRGYLPKTLVREHKILVKSSEVNIVVPTGRDDSGQENVSQNGTEGTEQLSLLNKTPELPVANSKGLFTMIGGVSADSVPPNLPDIKPQTTEKFQVLDGTTIPVYDDQTDESLQSTPQLQAAPKETSISNVEDTASINNVQGTASINNVQQTPPISNAQGTAPFSNVKETAPTNNVKETPPISNIQETAPINNVQGTVPISNVKEAATINNVQEISPNSNIQETVPINNVQETAPIDNVPFTPKNKALEENVKDESSVTEEQLKVETVKNIRANKEKHIESNEQTSEIEQEASEALEKSQTAEPSSDSLLGDLVNQISNFISSGTGEMENEEIEEEEEDENYEDENYEDEYGSTDDSNPDETESVDNSKKDEISKNSLQNEKEIKSSVLPEETNKLSPDNEMSESVKEEQNHLIGKNENVLESENVTDTLNVSKDESVKNDEYTKTEEVTKNEMQAESMNESSQTQPKGNDTAYNLDANVTNNSKDISNDFLKSGSTMDILSDNVNISAKEESNLLNDSFVETHEKLSGANETLSVNLSSDEDVTTASAENEALEALIPPFENPELSSQEEKTFVHPTMPSSGISSGVDVESTQQKISNDAKESGHSEDKPNYANDKHITKPVVEEPDFSSQSLPPEKDTTKKPLDMLIQSETLSSEHPFVSETTQPPEPYHSSGESQSSAFSNILKEPTDLPTLSSEEFDKEVSTTGEGNESVHSDISETSKEDNSYMPSANSMPDYIDEILMAEEEIKAKSHKSLSHESVSNVPPGRYDTEETKNDIIKDAHENLGGIFSWMNPVFVLFTSQSNEIETSSTLTSDGNVDVLKSESLDPAKIESISDNSCPSERIGEGDCGSLKEFPESKDATWQPSLKSTDMLAELDLLDRIPLKTTIWLIITTMAVLIFSLGYYYIEAHRRDGPLVAVINKFEREVLILKKENCVLEDKLQIVLQQLEDWNTNSSENDALIVDLKQELEETKIAKQELEEQVGLLEREVESVTENGLEMHRLLEESLSSQDGSQVLLSTVETLREKLERQEDEIAALSQSLSKKNVEVEELEKKLSQSAELTAGLEQKVVTITRDKDEEALQLKDKHRQLMAQLEEVIETKALDETRVSAEMSKLRLTIEELQKTVAEKDAELEEVKEVVKQLRSTDSNDKMDALFDVVSVRAQLQTAVGERDDFREKFHDEEGARKLLEGHMKKITQEVADLKNSFETAEKEKIEALTKLQVLSNYFKEKESQLQKELGLQESMWLQKQSDDHTIYEQMRSLREENEKYKLQNESLKKEIVEQESSFKIQIANVEQKSHENWVASRQAERRLKEVQQEASQLRNRLTMEKHSANYSMEDGPHVGSKPISESNGDPSSPPPSMMFPPTSSPPFMMYAMPPPGDFVPPPPLMGSPYPSDSRPPPLGRISSPPLDHRFSPPPPLPYPPYEYAPYGHHSPSPPPPIPSHSHHRSVHKPQPREMSREQKDHMMSNYATEGDNTVRKNKR